MAFETALSSGRKVTFGEMFSGEEYYSPAAVVYSCYPSLFKDGIRDPKVPIKEILELQNLGRSYIVASSKFNDFASWSLNLERLTEDRLLFEYKFIGGCCFLVQYTFGTIKPLLLDDAGNVVTLTIDCKFEDHGLVIEKDTDPWLILEDRLNLFLKEAKFEKYFKLSAIGRNHCLLELKT